MSVKRLLQEVDSREMAAWFAYDQRWPISDGWQQTARVCRVIMAASGNYKKKDIPEESVFIPSVKKPEQSQAQIISELMKLQAPPQG